MNKILALMLVLISSSCVVREVDMTGPVYGVSPIVETYYANGPTTQVWVNGSWIWGAGRWQWNRGYYSHRPVYSHPSYRSPSYRGYGRRR